MSKAFGISFVIGASVGASVAGAFASVEKKLKASQASFNDLSRRAKAYDTVIAKRSARDELKAKIADGDTDAKVLR